LDGLFGYDTNLLAGYAANAAPAASPGGTFTELSGIGQYSFSRTRFGASASGSITGRHSSAVNGVDPAYGFSASAWGQLARRTRITFAESSSFLPFLSYSFIPITPSTDLAEIVSPAYETAIAPQNEHSHILSAGLSQSLTSRSTLSFSGGYELFGTSSGLYDLTSYSADGRYSYQVGKGLGVHAGYGYSTGRYAGITDQASPSTHTIDVGVDFNRPLSFSRRTTLTFGTGSTGVSDSSGTHYYITGHARLTYEFKRSWSASVEYSRSANFVQTLREPVFGDAVTASVGGFASRRLQISGGVTGAYGNVGFSQTPGNKYADYSGFAHLTLALSSKLALTADYTYYRYQFNNMAQLPLFTASEMNRQSVEGGFTLRSSLRHARRSNAPR
jgi:hypothetical protein